MLAAHAGAEPKRDQESASSEAAEPSQSPGRPLHITRRSLLQGAFGIAALAALGGTSSALASETNLLRPPGGQDVDRFFGACIRCDRCVGACPTHAIGYATVEDGLLNLRTPVMRFRIGACDMCDGTFRCVAACPTGALTTFDPSQDAIGKAVIDLEECELFGVSGHCSAPCKEVCAWDALRIDADGRLAVDEDKCNGCGACELACVSGAYGGYGASGRRGINIETWQQRGNRE